MNRWAAIDYRDLWDVPRIFFASDDDHLYLFDCEFDPETEDYTEEYRVYAMPDLTPAELAGSWADFYQKATALLGTVPVTREMFDPTLRKQVDLAVLDTLAARPAV